jgi:hypothetical protein
MPESDDQVVQLYAKSQRDWLQIVGQFGVVASLIFVGLQMKQDQEIALSAAYQARTATLIEFLTTLASDEVTRSALAKTTTGTGDLTPEERVAAIVIAMAGRELMQNSHYQYSQGYLDEEHWQMVRRIIRQQLQNPVTRDGLLDASVRPSFRQVVEEIDREMRAEAE